MSVLLVNGHEYPRFNTFQIYEGQLVSLTVIRMLIPMTSGQLVPSL